MKRKITFLVTVLLCVLISVVCFAGCKPDETREGPLGIEKDNMRDAAIIFGEGGLYPASPNVKSIKLGTFPWGYIGDKKDKVEYMQEIDRMYWFETIEGREIYVNIERRTSPILDIKDPNWMWGDVKVRYSQDSNVILYRFIWPHTGGRLCDGDREFWYGYYIDTKISADADETEIQSAHDALRVYISNLKSGEEIIAA